MKNGIKAGLTAIVLFIAAKVMANDFADVEIKVTHAAGQVYLLEGAGGNIGLLATEAGLVLVDDQFAPLAQRIEAAMKAVNDQPLKYIVNTHYHGDHTGGNRYFGHHAPIFAHHNVRNRLAAKSSAGAVDLPVVTYDHGLSIHLTDETIELSHLPSGHTDGDTIVYFKQANVLHTGDLFFQGRFPYVDLNGGGSVKGYLKNIRTILAMMPDNVKIIPGHGKLADKASYAKVAEMIDYSLAYVSKQLEAGKSAEEIVAGDLGGQYADWGWEFISMQKWLQTVVSELQHSL